MIVADALSKSFGRRRPVTAVNNVSFSVDKGRVFGLLGPKDAGKTTLLRILAAILKPTSGSARVGGFDVLAQPGDAREVLGYMPEAADFTPWGTGSAFLDFWCRSSGVSGSKRRDKTRKLIEFFEMEDHVEENPNEYTVDLQKRLLLAQALIHDPSVLLLDEPMVGLRGDERGLFVRNLEELSKGGKTILLSTPLLSDVQVTCDHVALMVGGQASEVYEKLELLRKVGEGRHARVFVESDHVPAEAMSTLKGLDGVVDVRSSATAIIVYVDPGRVGPSDIGEALRGGDVKIRSISAAEITLGDVFRAMYGEEAA